MRYGQDLSLDIILFLEPERSCLLDFEKSSNDSSTS